MLRHLVENSKTVEGRAHLHGNVGIAQPARANATYAFQTSPTTPAFRAAMFSVERAQQSCVGGAHFVGPPSIGV